MTRDPKEIQMLGTVLRSLLGIEAGELIETDQRGPFIDLNSDRSLKLRLERLAERKRERAMSAEQEM